LSPRRFPPPWSVEELDACFVVPDQSGQQLAYVYFENEPGRRSAAKLLTHDRSKIIIEHDDYFKYWTRHFGVTKDESTQRNRKGWQLCRCSSQTT